MIKRSKIIFHYICYLIFTGRGGSHEFIPLLLGRAGNVLGKAVQGIGILAGSNDAIGAMGDAYQTIKDPGATGRQRAGAITKAVFKTAMVFARINSVVNLLLTVADVTDVTDNAFKW